jgi:glutamate 5-kinase
MQGEDIGTLVDIPPKRGGSFSGRKRWIAFFQKPMGSLVIDDGAREALEKKGKSLLPIGIRGVEGSFPVGAVVSVQTTNGELVARGLVEYSSHDIGIIKGHRTSEIAGLLGSKDYDEVIHRDNMVTLSAEEGGTS